MTDWAELILLFLFGAVLGFVIGVKAAVGTYADDCEKVGVIRINERVFKCEAKQ